MERRHHDPGAFVSTILIAQPDVALNEAWCEALTRNGHEVLAVTTIDDAVTRAREGGLDVIVLDVAVGEAGVRELVAELERLPDAPPLVLVSDSPAAPELSARVGAAGFLTKPCTAEDLLELVGRVTNATVRIPRFDDETTSPRNRDF